MKILIILITIVFVFNGCSLVKSAIAPLTPVKNTVPQKESKENKIVKCKGDIEIDKNGKIISCKGGFYSSEKTFNKTERKLNFREKIGQFISRLSGYAFLFVVISIFFFPGLIGAVFGRAIESTIGISKTTLTAVTRAVQKSRKSGVELNTSLNVELDDKHKKYITILKDAEKIT